MKNMRDWAVGRQPANEPLLRSKKHERDTPSTAAEDESFAELTVRRETVRQANHRDGDRHRLDEPLVEIVHEGERRTVTLVNLSGGGAMIEGGDGLKLWDRVFLQLGDCCQVEAAVRWIRGSRYGLEFAHETRIDGSQEETTRMLRAVISRSFPDVVAKAEAHQKEQVTAPSKAASATANQRDHVERELRHPLIWSGLVHYDHQKFEVRLRNVSAGGALVECSHPLHVGAELLLELGKAGSFFATVYWAHGDAAGLKFQQPFDLQHLASATPTVASERWVAPDYLRDSHSANGPWAKQWGRSDLGDLHKKLGS